MTSTSEPAAPTVLVASADPAVAEFLAALLERDGISSATVTADGAASTVTGADQAVELVLVDTDPATVRSIRSLADQDRARVPIVVLGATDLDADEVDAAHASATDAGADVWLPRPIDDTDLLAAVRQLID